MFIAESYCFDVVFIVYLEMLIYAKYTYNLVQHTRSFFTNTSLKNSSIVLAMQRFFKLS
jgi:hypothetical protein